MTSAANGRHVTLFTLKYAPSARLAKSPQFD